jgi:hypothetical protein
MSDAKRHQPESASSNPASANPASANPAPAPPQYVVVDKFSKNFFQIVPFVLLTFFGVAILLILLVLLLDARSHPEPDFVRTLTDGQYEMLVHDPSNTSWLRRGPAEDNFFRPGYAYLLLRTDADVLSKVESMNRQGFRFVPLDSLNEEDLWARARFRSEESIRKEIGAHADVPLEGECRAFLSEGDRENTYVCWFPETKLLLVIESDFWKEWYSDEKEQEKPRP